MDRPTWAHDVSLYAACAACLPPKVTREKNDRVPTASLTHRTAAISDEEKMRTDTEK